MRRKSFFFLVLSLVLLGGCSPIWQRFPTYDDLAFWKEQPDDKQLFADEPAEEWCYKTLGKVDCYPTAQKTLPERLQGVHPPDRRPQTRQDYEKELASQNIAESAQ
jgi:hypothetical protein